MAEDRDDEISEAVRNALMMKAMAHTRKCCVQMNHRCVEERCRARCRACNREDSEVAARKAYRLDKEATAWLKDAEAKEAVAAQVRAAIKQALGL